MKEKLIKIGLSLLVIIQVASLILFATLAILEIMGKKDLLNKILNLLY